MNTSKVFFLCSIIVLLIALILIVAIWRLKRHVSLTEIWKSLKVSSEAPPRLPVNLSSNLRTISYFDYNTLKKATGNFQPKNQLGSGGFGPVYQGRLDDERRIAVKQLCLGKSGQGETEFLAEVRMLSSIQHKNLVCLVGCCSAGSHRLVVYEFMENRSLDRFLFDNNEIFLNWKLRFKIILGIARGLQYLHEDSNVRIVHRDIKASNILLDERFQPKISDFGLARLFPEGEAYLSAQFAGTLGYTAPEYALKGELSEKADIYSFGVLILEIISSRTNTDLTLPHQMQYLPEYAWKLFDNSMIIELVDPRLKADGIEEADVLPVCQVALLCLQPSPSSRPSMSEVVSMLTSKAKQIPSPNKPVFMDRKNEINMDVVLPFSLESMSESSFPSPPSGSLTSPRSFVATSPLSKLQIEEPFQVKCERIHQ